MWQGREALTALETFAMEKEDTATRLQHEKEELIEELKIARSGQDRSAEEVCVCTCTCVCRIPLCNSPVIFRCACATTVTCCSQFSCVCVQALCFFVCVLLWIDCRG